MVRVRVVWKRRSAQNSSNEKSFSSDTATALQKNFEAKYYFIVAQKFFMDRKSEAAVTTRWSSYCWYLPHLQAKVMNYRMVAKNRKVLDRRG